MKKRREHTRSPVCLVTPTGMPELDAARARRDAPLIARLETAQRLWREGDPAQHLGVLIKGRLVACRHRRGTLLFCDFLQPPDVVGAQRPGDVYLFEVVALRRSLLLLLPNETFLRQVGSRPGLALKLLDRYGETINRMAARLETLSSGDVKHRLAQVLLELADRFGEPFDGGVLVSLKLGRDDLASMAATTRESVSRRLGEWDKKGIVHFQPAGYVVRDLAALRLAAGV